ncbi:MAG: DUF5372 family protein [Acidimicrobiales bacterium]
MRRRGDGRGIRGGRCVRAAPRTRSPKSSTTSDGDGQARTVRVTHPFHPWSGREFLFLSVGHNWGENRVFFLDDDGVKHSLPLGWTDAASVDVFVALATGRSPFRVDDLIVLADLVVRLSRAADEDV